MIEVAAAVALKRMERAGQAVLGRAFKGDL